MDFCKTKNNPLDPKCSIWNHSHSSSRFCNFFLPPWYNWKLLPGFRATFYFFFLFFRTSAVRNSCSFRMKKRTTRVFPERKCDRRLMDASKAADVRKVEFAQKSLFTVYGGERIKQRLFTVYYPFPWNFSCTHIFSFSFGRLNTPAPAELNLHYGTI